MCKFITAFIFIVSHSMSFCQTLGSYTGYYHDKPIKSRIELAENDSILFIGLNLGRLDTTYGTYTINKKIMTVKYLFYDFKLDQIECKNQNIAGINILGYQCYPSFIDFNNDRIEVSINDIDFNDDSFFIPFHDITFESINDTIHLNFKCINEFFDEKFVIDISKCYALKLNFYDGTSFDSKRLSKIIVKDKNTLIVDDVIFKRLR